MRYYAGMDVSLEETAICIVDERGKVIRELRATSEPDSLIETLADTGLSFERVGLEACSLSSWHLSVWFRLRGSPGEPAILGWARRMGSFFSYATWMTRRPRLRPRFVGSTAGWFVSPAAGRLATHGARGAN